MPTADEAYTPNHDGRVSAFEGGSIVYNYATSQTTATITPPTINVLTPPTCREGDVFSASVMSAVPGKQVTVQIIGDGNTVQYQFDPQTVDANGNATLALRMPYVLAKGYSIDGRNIRVTVGDYTQDFYVGLNEGLRVSLSTDNKIEEGHPLDVTVTNGIGESQVIIQLTHDNNEVVHEWGYMQTDGSGYGKYHLTIPQVLEGGYREDAYGIRVIHGGIVTEQKITITEGFRMVIGASKTREYNTFPMEVCNGPANATVTLAWYLDDSYRTTQTFHTDSNGDGCFTVTTPHPLILNSATVDTFRLIGTVGGQTFEFHIGVYRYISTDNSAVDSGASQPKVAGVTTGNKINTATGVPINTPQAANGDQSKNIITKAQNPGLAAPDAKVTISDITKEARKNNLSNPSLVLLSSVTWRAQPSKSSERSLSR